MRWARQINMTENLTAKFSYQAHLWTKTPHSSYYWPYAVLIPIKYPHCVCKFTLKEAFALCGGGGKSNHSEVICIAFKADDGSHRLFWFWSSEVWSVTDLHLKPYSSILPSFMFIVVKWWIRKNSFASSGCSGNANFWCWNFWNIEHFQYFRTRRSETSKII